MAFTDYESGGTSTSSTVSEEKATKDKKGYWSLAKLKRAYLDYLGTKREEIDEQQDARRFRHGSHWTQDQITQLNLRRQPIVHENIVGRKINGIVGTVQRLKQDPKAFPRTPQHEQGADLATAVIRYATERAGWDAKDPICAEIAAIDGIGGVEIVLTEGDHQDKEIDLEIVPCEDFFYDPRSRRADFSDARYMGLGKWMAVDQAIEMFPDSEEDIKQAQGNDYDLTSNSDFDSKKWFRSSEDGNEVRVVDLWYVYNGEWRYSIFTGNVKLMEGESFLIDENNKTFCKYIMFCAYIDQDGDRYGFVRDLKPLNQEVNMRKSKALYTMMSRRIIAPQGSFDDIEKARREAARSDGVVIYNPLGDAKPEFDDVARQAETNAQFQFYEAAKSALENFGPNVAVTGEGLENSSGRAIHLLQQAGLADLGPYIQNYRGWKIRVYRAIWNAIQRHWTGERWIRVTDDENLSHFIQVNGVGIDPHTGYPTLVNALGSLDVDIILDEGPDEVNAMGDAYDTLTLMVKSGGQVPPDILIELAPIGGALKKKILDRLRQPDPMKQQAQQVELQQNSAKTQDTLAAAKLKQAETIKTMIEAHQPPDQGQQGTMQMPDHPMTVQSQAEEKMAAANLKKAQAMKVMQDIQLEPQKMMMEQRNNEAERMMQAHQAQQEFAAQRQDAQREFAAGREDSQRSHSLNEQKVKNDAQARKAAQTKRP